MYSDYWLAYRPLCIEDYWMGNGQDCKNNQTKFALRRLQTVDQTTAIDSMPVCDVCVPQKTLIQILQHCSDIVV